MKPEDLTPVLLTLSIGAIVFLSLNLLITSNQEKKPQTPEVIATYKGCDLVRFYLSDKPHIHVLYCPTK